MDGRSTGSLDGMSAYKDALHLDAKWADDRVRLAAEFFAPGKVSLCLTGVSRFDRWTGASFAR